jgi:uncharacterized membrane protein YdbT with pleckstrin-like domain
MMNYFKKEDPKETMKKVKRETKREVRVRIPSEILATETDSSLAAATALYIKCNGLILTLLSISPISLILFAHMERDYCYALLLLSLPSAPYFVVSTAWLPIKLIVYVICIFSRINAIWNVKFAISIVKKSKPRRS